MRRLLERACGDRAQFALFGHQSGENPRFDGAPRKLNDLLRWRFLANYRLWWLNHPRLRPAMQIQASRKVTAQNRDVSGGGYLGFMIISCDTCAVKDIGCEDCILTFFISKSAEPTLCEIPDSTADAISLLSSRGIVRPLRFNTA